MKPEISVIIPTYNRAVVLKKSVQSVLNQSYDSIECIIVDDGSTDNTKEVVSSIDDPRIRYVFQNNAGACAARNHGICLAQGAYIAFHDSDDVWYPDKLEKQMNIMKTKSVDVVIGKLLVRGSDGRNIVYPKRINEGPVSSEDDLFGIGTQTILAKREVFETFTFDIAFPRYQDLEWMIRVLRRYRVYCLDEVMVDYEVGGDSISSDPVKMYRAIKMLEKKNPELKKKYPVLSLHIVKNLVKNWKSFAFVSKGQKKEYWGLVLRLYPGIFPVIQSCLKKTEKKRFLSQNTLGNDEQSRDSIQHVFICGAKSIGQYGGYETFVDKLSEYLQDNPNLKIHITCKANGIGAMDERKLQGVKPINTFEFEYHNAHCIKISVPRIGSAVAVYYDFISVCKCISYCHKNHVEHPIIYILTSRIGPFIPILKREIKNLGGTLHLNPDGHEWMRQKWSSYIKKYWKMSEHQMVKQADLIVCDSINIEAYIKSKYRKFNPATTYISYGADVNPSIFLDEDPAYVRWMRKKHLKKNEYYLIVGRFVPENNFEIMLREFMHSHTKRDLVIITNTNEKYMKTLKEKLNFQKDLRVKFVGSVYNEALLKKIRENAYAYFHGHEVGGTNPSLLEAMASTNLNLLLNVGFNREVGQDAAFYWNKEKGSLAALIEYVEQLDKKDVEVIGKKAKERIQNQYSWPFIAGRYLEIWTGEKLKNVNQS